MLCNVQTSSGFWLRKLLEEEGLVPTCRYKRAYYPIKDSDISKIGYNVKMYIRNAYETHKKEIIKLLPKEILLEKDAIPAELINKFYYYALYHCLDNVNIWKYAIKENGLVCFTDKCWIPGHYLYDDSETLEETLSYGPKLKNTSHDTIMILGISPGIQENKLRRNFCGVIGNKMLELFRNKGLFDNNCRVYVTNAVKWFHESATTTNIRFFMKDCWHALLNELMIVRPSVLIYFTHSQVTPYLERFCETQLCKDDVTLCTISAWPEQRQEQKECLIVPISFTVTQETEELIEQAVHYIRTKKISKSAKSESADYYLLTSAEEVKNVVDNILSTNPEYVSIDCEWKGKLKNKDSFLRCIQFCADGKTAFIIQTADEEGNEQFHDDKQQVKESLERLLLRQDITVVGSFIYTDMIWLKKYGVDITEKYKKIPEEYAYERLIKHDTGYKGIILDIAAAVRVSDEYARLDLCRIAKKFLNIASWDNDLIAWIAEYKRKQRKEKRDVIDDSYGSAPAHILYPYAAKDAIYTYKLAPILIEILSGKHNTNLWPAYWNTIRMCAAICEMMEAGVPINEVQYEVIKSNFERRLKEITDEIKDELHWEDFSFRKRDHVIAVIFGKDYVEETRRHLIPQIPSVGLEPIKATNKALMLKYKSWNRIPEHIREAAIPSVDKEVCGILRHKHPLIGKIADCIILDQALKTVFGEKGLKKFAEDDGRIRSFITPFLETGRCSSSKPNLQNLSNRQDEQYRRLNVLDKPLRSIFKAKPKYVLVSSDFVSAELFLLAVMSGDKTLLEHCIRAALPENHPDYFDIHANIAVQAFRLNCTPTKTGLASIGAKHLRVAAKSIIYGINYGRGLQAICRQVKSEVGITLTEEEANELLTTIHKTYPKLAPLQEELQKIPYTRGYQINYFGRKRTFPPSGNEAELNKQARESLNWPFQSMTAECLNMYAYRLWIHPDKEKIGYSILLPTHDSLLLEVRENNAQEFINDFLPTIVSSIKIQRWNSIGEIIEPDKWYTMSAESKILGEK